jgi:hypothetical protein
MSLEYDWTSNTYRSRLDDAFMPVDGWRSFQTHAAARHQLRLVGLRIGNKTDPRTWRVEVMELVSASSQCGRYSTRQLQHI